MKELGKRIRDRRTDMGLTMAELGHLVGLQASMINKLEHAEVKYVERDRIAKLAQALKCDPAWLMGFDTPSDVTVTYQAPGKDTVTTMVVDRSAPLMGESAKRAALYAAALGVAPQNLDVAIELLKSLSEVRDNNSQ